MKALPLASKIVLLTGWRGAGKTTLCQRWVEAARLAGWDVAGVISPARLDGGEKTGIQVENLRTGERCLLASRFAGELVGFNLGPWTFDPLALEWGSQVIAAATPCGLLVIDELGPLEFEQGRGWTISFQVLDRGDYSQALVVIRPECRERFLSRWTQAKEIDITSMGYNRA